MTIPTQQELAEMGFVPLTLTARLRDYGSRLLLGMGIIAVPMSALSLISIGLFIGVGTAGLFLLGALAYPTRGRWTLAIGGLAWSVFCLVILVIAQFRDL